MSSSARSAPTGVSISHIELRLTRLVHRTVGPRRCQTAGMAREGEPLSPGTRPRWPRYAIGLVVFFGAMVALNVETGDPAGTAVRKALFVVVLIVIFEGLWLFVERRLRSRHRDSTG
jgi:hypothetical protein